jgi:Fe2+ or Zn2+ uptake regulation protein
MPALSSAGRERQTRQRDALMQALRDSARALSPAELCALGQRSVPTLNLSTVYRQLAALLEAGEVLKVDLPGQSARYEAVCVRSRHAGEHGTTLAITTTIISTAPPAAASFRFMPARARWTIWPRPVSGSHAMT